METTGTWPLQSWAPKERRCGEAGGCGAKPSASASVWLTVSHSRQIQDIFSCVLFLTSKMSVCCKLFITVWWWKCFGSDLGRGGSSGQWGMTGMWEGEMIDRQKTESVEGFCYEEMTPPPPHAAITSQRWNTNTCQQCVKCWIRIIMCV